MKRCGRSEFSCSASVTAVIGTVIKMYQVHVDGEWKEDQSGRWWLNKWSERLFLLHRHTPNEQLHRRVKQSSELRVSSGFGMPRPRLQRQQPECFTELDRHRAVILVYEINPDSEETRAANRQRYQNRDEAIFCPSSLLRSHTDSAHRQRIQYWMSSLPRTGAGIWGNKVFHATLHSPDFDHYRNMQMILDREPWYRCGMGGLRQRCQGRQQQR